MFNKIYYRFHCLISKSQEKNEYSRGYWQDRVRKEILILCQGVRGKVLEVGCGEGLFLAQLARQNPILEIWGVDNHNERLNQAKERVKQVNLNNINVVQGNAEALSFNDEYFDAVLCINVLFNLRSLDLIKQTLSQMKRVCKKGGKIIFDFRNSLNTLLEVKYKLARYYDDTVKNLPLLCYSLKQFEFMLRELNLEITDKLFIDYFVLKRFAPIIIIEAQKL